MTDNQPVIAPKSKLQKGILDTPQRDSSIDSLKFLLICTVVLGHVIMALGGGKMEMAMFNFIYSFHMPLFVFLSGYFTRPGELTEKSVRGAFHFLSLFVIFDLLMWLVVPRDVNYRNTDTTIRHVVSAQHVLLAFLVHVRKKGMVDLEKSCHSDCLLGIGGFCPVYK